MILMYHKVHPESKTMWWVDVDSFYRQMCELKCRKVVYLDDYDPADPDQVVITFDGIYKNVLIFAAPILQHFGYPFELFVASDYIGKDNSFDTSEPKAEFASAEDLRELVKSNGRLQWHSKTHSNMKEVLDTAVIASELTIPEEVKQLDEKGFQWFGYPHGDFNPLLVERTKQSFKGGISCVQGNDTDSYVLNRVTVTNETTFKKGRITVIIPSYNYGAYLVEAIESVLRQTRPVDEIIIADDRSTDNTMEIGEDYATRYPALIRSYRNEQNLGIVKNFNKAVAEATGDYICFLGADNRFRSDYIEKTAEILDSENRIAIAYTDFAMFGPRAKIMYQERFKDDMKGPIKEGVYYIVNFPEFDEAAIKRLERENIFHGSSMFKKKAFDEVGGYKDENDMPEDYNLFVRMVKKGWSAKRAPYPVLEYRQHSREQFQLKAISSAELNYYKAHFKLERQELARKIQILATRDQQINQFSQQLTELNKQLTSQKQESAKLQQRITVVEKQVQEKTAKIHEILTSMSWKITAPLRKIYEVFLKTSKNSVGKKDARNQKQSFITRTFHNVSTVIKTYDFRQVIPNIRAYGLKTFLQNAIREISRPTYQKPMQQPAAPKKPGARERDSFPGHSKTKGQPLIEITQVEPISPERIWQDYEIASQRIMQMKTDRLRHVKVKAADMISVKENKVKTAVESLSLPMVEKPNVSIVIPVHNNLPLTMECLLTIAEHTGNIHYEIIVIDDGSTDQTQEILSAVSNLLYVRNSENLGFVRTCNRGAEKARGQYLLFLNNDVQVTKGWLEELMKPFDEFDNVGAVGPKILYPNGRLQEAGVHITRDCAAELIGLTDDPSLPRYNYMREVDYCSGVCLLIEKEQFQRLEGFDENLAPSYCEDADLCLGLRNMNLRIIYNPNSVIIHHLSATSDKLSNSYKLSQVTTNQQKLSEKWQGTIDNLNKIRLIAFYLPQFHPIPENDLWWGKGFTEWRNVAKARPNFVGHYQPRVPADLGYYDLRIPEVMEQQAELAKRYGLFGFCYYYYWFGGKRLLEMPLERMLATNKPDIPFCLCWANENWSRRWDGREKDILMGQAHSDEDDRAVMLDLIRYMRHPDYIRIDGKPLLLVYRVNLFPDIRHTVDIWRNVSRKEGLGEIYLAMVECFEHAYAGDHPAKYGFDASVEFPPHGTDAPIEKPGQILNPHFKGSINDYRELVLKYMKREVPGHKRFRSVLTSWDNTPRRQDDPYIFHHATPGAYQAWLEAIIKQTHEQNFGDERIVFITAWNEWAEGAYLEPDQRFGHGYLEATCNALESWLLQTRK